MHFTEAQISDIAKQFNDRPKNAINTIKVLCQQNGIQDTAVQEQQIAEFLFKHRAQIDFRQLGDFLSEPGPAKKTANPILTAFVQQIDFSQLEFVAAFRDYFKNYFMLPGEGQKIDRLIDAFATRFAAQHKINNPEETHQLGILAFAMMALNTDLHNPNQKTKMSKQQFLKNTQPSVSLYQPKYLEDIYDDISQSALPLPVQAAVQPEAAAPAKKTNFFQLDIANNKTTPSVWAVNEAISQLGGILRKSNKEVASQILERIPEVNSNYTVTVKRPFWKNLFGKAATITLTDPTDGKTQTLKVFTPNLIGRLFGKQQKLSTPQCIVEGTNVRQALVAQAVAAVAKTVPDNALQNIEAAGKKAAAKALGNAHRTMTPELEQRQKMEATKATSADRKPNMDGPDMNL